MNHAATAAAVPLAYLPERVAARTDAARLLVLLDRIAALPEAGVMSMEAYCTRVEGMHGVRWPADLADCEVRMPEASG